MSEALTYFEPKKSNSLQSGDATHDRHLALVANHTDESVTLPSDAVQDEIYFHFNPNRIVGTVAIEATETTRQSEIIRVVALEAIEYSGLTMPRARETLDELRIFTSRKRSFGNLGSQRIDRTVPAEEVFATLNAELKENKDPLWQAAKQLKEEYGTLSSVVLNGMKYFLYVAGRAESIKAIYELKVQEIAEKNQDKKE